MNAPTKVEIKQAGQSVMVAVASCRMATVGQYPEVEFIGTDERNQLVLVAVNKKSADRQLERCNLTMETAAGKVLRFGRSANAKDATKPFWDIEVVGNSGNGTAHEPAPKPVAPKAAVVEPPKDDAPHPAEREAAKPELSARDLYIAITKDTLKEIVPLYVEAKVPVEMSAVAAIVATRFIGAQRNGH